MSVMNGRLLESKSACHFCEGDDVDSCLEGEEMCGASEGYMFNAFDDLGFFSGPQPFDRSRPQ